MVYYGLKQGQITQNFDNKYVLILIHLIAQCSKITYMVLFLQSILLHFSAFCCFLLVMSECLKVHFVVLRFISESNDYRYFCKQICWEIFTGYNLHLHHWIPEFNFPPH